MFEHLTQYVSDSPWTYAFLFAVAALDVLVPIVPSETSAILAGVLAGAGDLILPLAIASAALGAILGDNVAYWIGRTAGGPIERRLFSGDRRRRLEWAEHQLDLRGGYLIVVGRFIPGGRSAVCIAAGILDYPYRRFVPFDVLAGVIWAGYAVLLGYFGGRAFEEQPWKGFVAAFAIAVAVTALIEGVRWYRRRSPSPA